MVETLTGRFQALRDAYAAQLPSKIGRMGELWAALESGPWDLNAVQTLHRMAHSLAGSGSTLGYPMVGQRARELEETLKPLLQGPEAPADERRRGISSALRLLQELQSSVPEGKVGEESSILRPPGPGTRNRRLLYLVGKDESLAHQIEHFGYKVEILADFALLRETVAVREPGAILADMALGGPGEAAWEMSLLHKECAAPIPVLFISSEDDLSSRLQAVHAGGQGYFHRPIDMGWLVDKLDEVTGRIPPEAPRILIVEDDPLLAAHNALVLEQAGMVTRTVTDPLKVLEPLSEFRPDLILMDFYMPECNGLELASVVRQHEDFVRIPIVFLSTETRVDKRLDAMMAGGDDFLTKPIAREHLIASVEARVRRSRMLRSMMERDGLTRLLNHTNARGHLEIELTRAQRLGSRLAYAMLDLDHFKSVNDTHGHRAGDRVLKSFSRLLRQRFRNTDIVGRYGGEEFVVILTELDAGSAAILLEGVRATFEKVRHVGRDCMFNVTFSAGVADYPRYANGSELHEAADRALYRAKSWGRNQVVVASDTELRK